MDKILSVASEITFIAQTVLRRGLNWAADILADGEISSKSPLKANLSQYWWTLGNFFIYIMRIVGLSSDV